MHPSDYRATVALWQMDNVDPKHVKTLARCARDLQRALDEIEIIRAFSSSEVLAKVKNEMSIRKANGMS